MHNSNQQKYTENIVNFIARKNIVNFIAKENNKITLQTIVSAYNCFKLENYLEEKIKTKK